MGGRRIDDEGEELKWLWWVLHRWCFCDGRIVL
jgi:hypothetical protein